MSPNIQIDTGNTVFRIDKFVVPEDVENVFLSKLQEIHTFVKQQAGCLKTRILRQVGGIGKFNVVAYIEWADEVAVKEAVENVQAWFAQQQFNPQSFTQKLGIQSDLGIYQCFSENVLVPD